MPPDTPALRLNRVADTDPARRIRILSTLAAELSRDLDADRGWRYAVEALDTARRFGRPEELSVVVSAYLLSALTTERLEERRTLLDEMTNDHQRDLTLPAQALLQANLWAQVAIELGIPDPE